MAEGATKLFITFCQSYNIMALCWNSPRFHIISVFFIFCAFFFCLPVCHDIVKYVNNNEKKTTSFLGWTTEPCCVLQRGSLLTTVSFCRSHKKRSGGWSQMKRWKSKGREKKRRRGEGARCCKVRVTWWVPAVKVVHFPWAMFTLLETGSVRLKISEGRSGQCCIQS